MQWMEQPLSSQLIVEEGLLNVLILNTM